MRRAILLSLTALLVLAACTPSVQPTPAPPAATAAVPPELTQAPVTQPTSPAAAGAGLGTSAAPTAIVAAAATTALPATPTTAPSPTNLPATALPPTPTVAPVPTATTAPSPTVRPTNTAQPTAQATAPAPSSIHLQPVADGLAAPVALVAAPDDTGRLFVVDQTGLIRIVDRNGKLLPDPFLDVRDRMVPLNAGYDERGLLGLAFHPDFVHNQRLFVYYTAPLRQGGTAGYDNTERLSEFKVAAGSPDRADAGSERVLLQIDHPQPNHNGGAVAFGPDGFLYLSIGDGGGANDVASGHTPRVGNAQDTTRLLGKILRIDVNAGDPYAIPPDNPFAAGGGAAEVYAYGLRNAYRFSFDTGGSYQLIAADVGQGIYEEVDIVTRGGNYGWHIREGAHCFAPGNVGLPPNTCPETGAKGEPLIDPVLEYAHPDPGIAIVGGFVYRGAGLPGLAGRYVFGDWSTSFGAPDGSLLVAQPAASGQGAWSFQRLAVADSPNGRLGHFLLGLGQDRAGEIYVLTADRSGPSGTTGRVFKIMP